MPSENICVENYTRKMHFRNANAKRMRKWPLVPEQVSNNEDDDDEGDLGEGDDLGEHFVKDANDLRVQIVRPSSTLVLPDGQVSEKSSQSGDG